MLVGKSELKFMKQCESSLRINIDYVNSLQGSDESEQEIEKEIEKVIQNAHIPTKHTDNHVDRLVKFYEAQDDEIKSNFFRNIMTQLMHVKKLSTTSPQVGFVTGKDSMKTYHLVSNRVDTEDILRDNRVSYVRKHT